MDRKNVIIPNELVKGKEWKDSVLFMYLLDKNTIGISPTIESSWLENCIRYYVVDYKVTKEGISVTIPDDVYNFYLLMQPETKLTVSGLKDAVLVTVIWEK